MQNIKIYLITVVVFFLVDILWLGFIAKNLYNKYLGHLMAPKVNWTAAIVFYLLFIVGLVIFVINPAIEKDSLKYAFLVGGFFGFITYSTYDLTNLSTLKDWPLMVSIIDIVWGSLLNSATAGITFMVFSKFFK